MAKDNVMIGLEIHGYLDTLEKLFCDCENFHDMKKIGANENICPICTGQPGSKPMLVNGSAVDKILQIGLMLGCKVNVVEDGRVMIFQRKHYDWPDMPQGFQKTISGAYSTHVAEHGKFLGIGIREVHLEEDPAAWNPDKGTVDYNRAGAPLVEIVTEPDFTSASQVEEWLKKLVLTLSYIKALNKDAGIKADVNVNISGVSVRAEIKNVNSISEISRAIRAEVERHKKDKPSKMETRRWNSVEGVTELMRLKEGAADYRFIPDPDLPALQISSSRVRELKKKLPESPMEKLDKIIKKYGIGSQDAGVLVSNIDIAELYERIIEKIDAKFALPWITVEWFSVLNYNKKSMDDVDVKVEHFVELLELIRDGKITPLKGKEIIRKFVPKSFSCSGEVSSAGKIDDVEKLREIVKKVLKENARSVNDYKKGEINAFNFLMGCVMKETDRRADFALVRDILGKELK